MTQAPKSDGEEDAALVCSLIRFTRRLGITVRCKPIETPTFLPGLRIRRGRLIVDQARLGFAGDILHEAGHIAVCDPDTRAELGDIEPDGGDEMAAIAWSFAAAQACGLDLDVLFHHGGYLGGGGSLKANFEAGRYVGVSLLQWFGMTVEPRSAQPEGPEPYPHMLRWLR